MPSSVPRIAALTAATSTLAMLASCQTLTEPARPDSPAVQVSNLDGSPPTVIRVDDELADGVAVSPVTAAPPSSTVTRRSLPRIGIGSARDTSLAGGQRPRFDDERLTVALPPQPVPEFVNSVFGEILGLGFTLGPSVSDMASIVAFRSANNIGKGELFDAAVAALQTYGVAVYQGEEQLEIVMEDTLRQQAPRFIRSRARNSVPRGLRPVVQFVDLYAIPVDEMMQILTQSFPDGQRLTIVPNPGSNSITLTGLPKDVDRALSIINQMDELRFAGEQIATVKVVNWDVEELATVATELLRTEGYSVSGQTAFIRSITFRTIPFTNQVVVYAREPDMLDYAVQTLLRLDREAARPEDVEQARIYNAQHYTADDLIALVSSIVGAGSAGSPDDGPALSAQDAATGSRGPDLDEDDQDDESGVGVASSGFVADEQSNRIIFNATDERYAEILGLLRQLDTPAPEVLIEVTIAEITLTANTRSGVEFLLNQIGSTGYTIGTRGGLGLATGGIFGNINSDDLVVDFGALSSNNLIQVLSTPRVVTKSGSTASVQVGTDVPIITTQSTGPAQVGGTSEVLQNVEYRETGVILDVSPVVLSADRIDLTISQEVSSAEENENQAISSPVISNRSITSELTLQDGQSAILGGLIENRYTEGSSGIPFLKDIPLIGRIFGTETLRDTDTVLLFLITPYILDTADDRARAADALVGSVNKAFNVDNKQDGTLMPRDEPSVVITRSPVVVDR